jgi:arylsulfatase A-like enzyme
MIEQLDQAVGIVLAKLDEHGLDDNTIVCFTSDNGGVSSGDAYATSNLPLRGGKGRQWEGGIREPFYIKAPGVSKQGLKNATPGKWNRLVPHLAGALRDRNSKKTKSGWSQFGTSSKW